MILRSCPGALVCWERLDCCWPDRGAPRPRARPEAFSQVSGPIRQRLVCKRLGNLAHISGLPKKSISVRKCECGNLPRLIRRCGGGKRQRDGRTAMTGTKPAYVAVVDDDESVREALPDLLREF